MTQFSGSPAVTSYEIDVTAIVPSVPTSTGALAGLFRWGPVNYVTQVSDEKTLVQIFGQPTNYNAETFFTAANFLAYTSSLYVVRTANTTGNSTVITNTVLNAVVGSSNTFSNTVMLNSIVTSPTTYANDVFDSSVYYVAKYPGALGNSLQVSVCDSVAAYSANLALSPNSQINTAATSITFTIGSNVASIAITPSGTGTGATTLAVANNILASVSVGDYVIAGNSTTGQQLLKVTNVSTPVQGGSNASMTISFSSNYNRGVNYTDVYVNRQWQYAVATAKAPTTSPYQAAAIGANNSAIDQIHVVVVDQDGQFSGVPGTVLEVFPALSRATDAVDSAGMSTYYATVINNSSNYIWWANDAAGAPSALSTALVSSTNVIPQGGSLINGQDGLGEASVPLSTIVNGYDLFLDDSLQISLVMQGTAKGGTYGEGLANYIIGNLLTVRQDCFGLFSAPASATVNVQPLTQINNLLNFRYALTTTSYASMDSSYKYQYDKYNNVYRWLPMNGDFAGIIAQSDFTNAAWWSPAGYNRGQVKNIIKLAFNPNKTFRDTLFNADINPFVTQKGSGTLLLGDKTLIGTTSAFNAINVRRLFIVLRESIDIAAKALLFEFNDPFTQQQFVNMVEPFLRNIQGQRGITDFNVVADGTVNTPFVVDSDGFIGLIQIKPARAIRYINLYFQAVGSGVEFASVEGSALV